MKTVYDPNTRRYKNVPVAQQPGDKKWELIDSTATVSNM
jgi:hypothetical protein